MFLSSSIIFLLLLLSPIRDDGWSNLEKVSLFFTFLVLVCTLVYRETVAIEPFIPFSVFQKSHFRLAILHGITHAATIQGLVYLLQYYFQSVQGYTPMESGFLWMLMSSATLIASLSVLDF